MDNSSHLRRDLLALADPEKAKILQGFFKTGIGTYGEGDCFVGITVPKIRSFAKKVGRIPLSDLEPLFQDNIHECRLFVLLNLVEQFRVSKNEDERKALYEFYLSNTGFINNWDLVDLSAYQIVGMYLRQKDRAPLYRLAKSSSIWEQRIAIVGTWKYIREKDFQDTLKIARILLLNEYDLIRKAVGWMLREVGKQDKETLIDFLKENYSVMPRTMLRYAIERLSPEEKSFFMKTKAKTK